MAAVASRTLRWTALTLLWAALAFGAGIAAAFTVPALFGYKPLTVLSGSMEPALHTGGMVVDEVIAPLQARPGDVVTFNDPEDQGRLITHRLRSIRVESGKAYMVTRGDANDTSERWNVPLDSEIGRVVYQVPALGYVRSWISGSTARLALLALVGCLGLWMLIDIWRPGREAAGDGDRSRA